MLSLYRLIKVFEGLFIYTNSAIEEFTCVESQMPSGMIHARTQVL